MSFGIDRNLWALLDLGFAKADRSVLRLAPRLAPVPVAVFPLVSKDGLAERARSVWRMVRRRWRAAYDDSGSIGKRYARMDEVGTPFCVTIDHDTLHDGMVTVRERDTTAQQRIPEASLTDSLAKMLGERGPEATLAPI